MKPFSLLFLILTSCTSFQYHWNAPMQMINGIPAIAPSIPICVYNSNLPDHMKRKVFQATTEWNNLLEGMIFISIYDCKAAIRTVVTVREVNISSPLAATKKRWYSERMGWYGIQMNRDIYFSNSLDQMFTTNSHNIIMHQFGHILGLDDSAHCDNYMSNPVLCPVKLDDNHTRNINADQKERLQRLYGLGSHKYY